MQGKNAALNAASLGLNVSLTHIAVGTGKYDPSNAMTLTNTSLVSELERYPLNGGSVEPVSHTLRFVANLEPTLTADAFEIGLITDQGVLFAVAATTSNTPLIRLVANIVAIVTFGMILSNLNLSNLIINVDPNTPISVALMNQHLANIDPHPQYTKNSDFNIFKDQNTLEHNNLITLINAAIQSGQINLEDAVDFLTALINQHKNASNPHPQYLLASTFGVELAMNATLNTNIIDKNRVFGWNGETGDSLMIDVSPGWWSTHQQTTTFKPYRAFGKFLLAADLVTSGRILINVKTFDKNGVLISDTNAFDVDDKYRGSETVKFVFELVQGGYAEIYFHVGTYNHVYSAARASIYVDDRVKIFKPVGYSSIVDSTDFNSGDSSVIESNIDFSIYPNYEWFYYSNSQSQYIQLSSNSSFVEPVNRSPHFNRTLLSGHLEIDLWIIIEVGMQSTESPNDYSIIESIIVRGATDTNGNIVITIPLSMRNPQVTSGFKLIYKVAYYDHLVEKTEVNFPQNSLDGEHIIYVGGA